MLNKYYFVLLFYLCCRVTAKSSEEKTSQNGDMKITKSDGAALMFADDLKQTLERYLFGICPQPFKSRWSQMAMNNKNKNGTAACDLDVDQHDLAGRLATLSLRAHAASRTDCLRLGTALANTLAELARTAQATNPLAQANANEKKRKLSKSQKAKIQAKQRTALAVKKKAAAAAAAAAAKLQLATLPHTAPRSVRLRLKALADTLAELTLAEHDTSTLTQANGNEKKRKLSKKQKKAKMHAKQRTALAVKKRAAAAAAAAAAAKLQTS